MSFLARFVSLQWWLLVLVHQPVQRGTFDRSAMALLRKAVNYIEPRRWRALCVLCAQFAALASRHYRLPGTGFKGMSLLIVQCVGNSADCCM